MVENSDITDPCKFGIVPQVKIEHVNDTSVSFATRSASRSGDRHEHLRRTFTVPLTEVHTTAVAGVPAPVAMRAGATGPLFLSRGGWATPSMDGFPIYGSDRALFKIPDCAAAPMRLLSKLIVVPTSIAMRGHLESETEFFDIELLGPDAVGSQRIVWKGADYVELRLTSQGARRLQRRSRPTTVKLWPIWITIKGSPVIDPAVFGEVDILNHEVADGDQDIVFAKPGAPIVLSLTQEGVSAFHVTPQAVAERSSDIGRAKRPCPGCAQQELAHAGRRATGVTRRRSVA